MLGLLGDEWTLLIIQQALLGATRYGEFMRRLADLEFGAHQPVAGADGERAAGSRDVPDPARFAPSI